MTKATKNKYGSDKLKKFARVHDTESDGKSLAMIACNPSGFHFLKYLPNRMIFNNRYSINEILAPLLDSYRTEFDGTHRRWIIPADHARPESARVPSQFCESKEITQIRYLPYSPDVAPFGFYFCGFIKNGLRGTAYEKADDLFGAIGAILEELKWDILERIFRHWMLTVEVWISESGYSVPEATRTMQT
jgi:hypothetical protein